MYDFLKICKEKKIQKFLDHDQKSINTFKGFFFNKLYLKKLDKNQIFKVLFKFFPKNFFLFNYSKVKKKQKNFEKIFIKFIFSLKSLFCLKFCF